MRGKIYTSTNVLIILALYGFTACVSSGCRTETSGVSPRKMADALHAVIESHRTVYAQNVVNPHWKNMATLPLPSQMLRNSAELVAQQDAGFTYSLLSMWAVNKQNLPQTAVEKAGLRHVADNPEENYYAFEGEEKSGGGKYFTGVYADKAVAQACIDCHNSNPNSSRSDFKIGDVMGGVVIRIRLDRL